MTWSVAKRVVLIGAILLLPVAAFAQESVLTGTVTDSTGAVLPGVTVTASNEATGNKFVGVTDERGIYRIPVRVGSYQVTAELQGFSTASRMGINLLVGQTATLDMRMAPSTVQETVTVTGEAPLIDLKNSSLGGNIDPKQVQDIPINGRNWIGLALLAPGSRTDPLSNSPTPLPDRNGGEAREFQLNVDGQQVSADIGTGGQPKYSSDSIAEFQFVSNRFDATMGRSSGVQVNAITKSGTNQLSGLVRGNFRDSRFNAKNPVLGIVEPIKNQQYSFTLGGPVIKDRLQYFGNYEHERQPQTATFNTPYPAFNVQTTGTDTQDKAGLRLDFQFSPKAHIMGKISRGVLDQPMVPGNTQSYPSAVGTNREYNDERLADFTQVLSNKAVNEIKGGEAVFGLSNKNLTTWSNHWQKADGINTGSPRITFRGFSIGGNQNYPRHQDQWVWNVRDDFTYSYEAKGRHDLRLGGEFLHRHQIQDNCRQCMGTVTASGIAAPNPAQMQAWFPDPFNADTWNLAAISPWVTTYDIGVGDFNVHLYSKKVAAWAQDDWAVSNRMTLNLGLRYDVEIGAFANDVSMPPFQQAGRPVDKLNFQPRLGFNYKVNDMTVVRGGAGLYYGDALGADQSFATGNPQINIIEYTNDGRADFAANPTNGAPLPNYAQATAQNCSGNVAAFNAWKAVNFTGPAPCLTRSLQEFVGLPQYVHLPRTFQTSIGFQRQIGATAAFQSDFVWFKGTHEKDVVDNINLTFDPNTGLNLPFANRATRPFPDWGVVSMNTHLGRSEYYGVQSELTKRFSNRWQASATYTLSWLYNANTKPFSGLTQVSFPLSPAYGGEWGLSADDQRHRVVLNGVWSVYKGFQLSGLHYLGAGIRDTAIYGGDIKGVGCSCFDQRFRPDNSIVPRNALIVPAQNRTDLRLQQKVPIGGRRSFDLIADVLNVFNRPNWGIGENEATASQYLQHVSATVRTMQFGFRLTY
jgi:carboxypeptidase family protein/TonB-dependent receptor-like protein